MRATQCGFCESNCPSRDVTLTPRQRIATYKEIARLRGMPTKGPEEAARCVLRGTPSAAQHLATAQRLLHAHVHYDAYKHPQPRDV